MITKIFIAVIACSLLSLLLCVYQEKLIKKYIPEEYETSGTRSRKTKILQTLAAAIIGAITGYLSFVNTVAVSFSGLAIRIELNYIFLAVAAVILLSVFTVDLYHYVIFDRFHVALAVLALARHACNNFAYIKDGLLGAVIAAALFGLVAFIGYKKYGKDAMGLGDVKLVTVMGFFIGWKNLLVAVLIAAVAGSIILLILQKKNNGEKDKEYPFAPFLASGFIVAMFFGDAIISSYLNLFIR